MLVVSHRFVTDGAPFNKVVGLGFSGVPGEAALDEVEASYADRGAGTASRWAVWLSPTGLHNWWVRPPRRSTVDGVCSPLLLAIRLAEAVAAGCDIAVVTTAPGSKSQQNVQRQGFHFLYTRAVLVKVTE